MESLSIDVGEIRLAINNDPERVITFNPADAAFAERFYKVVDEFQAKSIQYQRQADETLTDEQAIALLKDTCVYVRDRIDYVFGADTSQKAFGDALVLDMFSQFFEGITPYIQKTRTAKLKQYLPPAKVNKPRKRK